MLKGMRARELMGCVTLFCRQVLGLLCSLQSSIRALLLQGHGSQRIRSRILLDSATLWIMKPRIRATLAAALKKRLLGVAHRLSERIHPTNASGNNTSMR